MLKKRWYRIVLLALAVVLYVVANMLDYSYTVRGIASGISTEGNPVAQKFIEQFGLEKGLLLFKTIFLVFIISCTITLEIKYCQKKKIPSPSTLSCCILCSGAILKLGAVGMWLYLFLSS